MKKVLSFILILVLVLSLAACKDEPSATTDSAGTDNSVTEATETEPGEIYEVVMQFPTLGNVPVDLQMVEDAINARTEGEIGVHVTLYPVTAWELNNTTSLMVSAGEKLDLAMSMFEGGVGGYVNRGAVIELDELVAEYGADIVAAEGVAMSGGYFDGQLYGVPTEEKMGRVKAFFARADLVEKYDIQYDPDHVYTYEELGDIFAVVQAGEGDGFYSIAANGNEDPLFTFFNPVDYLGANLASGALMNYGQDSSTIVNYFETAEFAEACDSLRGWYESGYLSPDCNTATDASTTLMQSGNYFGFFTNGEPDMIASATVAYNSYLNTDVVPFYTSKPAALTQNYQFTLWMIPITCENPEKTMQWLNMMYADEEMINILYRGIEGVHYEFTEDSSKVITFPEGVDFSNVGYMALLNVWGDKSKDYVMAPLDETYYDQLASFNNSIAPEYTSAALGYCFNSDSVKTQAAAVGDVINRYQASLSLGVVDPAVVLPEFLDALQAAGIEEIITENQAQYDQWLAGQ